jgi:hypothetical protein
MLTLSKILSHLTYRSRIGMRAGFGLSKSPCVGGGESFFVLLSLSHACRSILIAGAYLGTGPINLSIDADLSWVFLRVEVVHRKGLLYFHRLSL